MARHISALCGLCFVLSLACDAGRTPAGGDQRTAELASSSDTLAGAAGAQQTRTIGPSWRVLALGYDAAAIWDGATWTAHPIPRGSWGTFSGTVYTAAAWNGSLLTAMGGAPPEVATSHDGVTWVNEEGPIWYGESLSGLTWAGTSFVAVGTFDGYWAISFTSADAASPWTGPSYAAGASFFQTVDWNGSVLVAAGTKVIDIMTFESVGIVATSTDLVSWSVLPVPAPFAFMTSVVAVGSSFVAIGVDSSSSCVFATSTDGVSWAAGTIPGATECLAAASSGSEYVVLGTSASGATAAFVSVDGVTWEGPFAAPQIQYGTITWSGSQYVSVGGAGNPGDTVFATSRDGRTWTDAGSVPLTLGGFRGSLLPFVAPPRIDATSPTRGLVAGGVPVRLSGDFFQTGATVTFGAAPARRVAVVSPTTIWATPPAHDPGAVDVTVTNPDGQTAALAGAYEYSAPPPPRP